MLIADHLPRAHDALSAIVVRDFTDRSLMLSDKTEIHHPSEGGGIVR